MGENTMFIICSNKIRRPQCWSVEVTKSPKRSGAFLNKHHDWTAFSPRSLDSPPKFTDTGLLFFFFHESIIKTLYSQIQLPQCYMLFFKIQKQELQFVLGHPFQNVMHHINWEVLICVKIWQWIQWTWPLHTKNKEEMDYQPFLDSEQCGCLLEESSENSVWKFSFSAKQNLQQ